MGKKLEEMINELKGETNILSSDTTEPSVNPIAVVEEALRDAKQQAMKLNISESEFMAAVAKFFAEQGYEVTSRPAEVLKASEDAALAIEQAISNIHDKVTELNETFDELTDRIADLEDRVDKITLFVESVEDGAEAGQSIENQIRSISEKVDYLEIDKDVIKDLVKEAISEVFDSNITSDRFVKRILHDISEKVDYLEIDKEALKSVIKEAVNEINIELDPRELFKTRAFKEAVQDAMEEMEVVSASDPYPKGFDTFPPSKRLPGPAIEEEEEELPGAETDFGQEIELETEPEAPEVEIEDDRGIEEIEPESEEIEPEITAEEEEEEEEKERAEADQVDQIDQTESKKKKKGKIGLRESLKSLSGDDPGIDSKSILKILNEGSLSTSRTKPFRRHISRSR